MNEYYNDKIDQMDRLYEQGAYIGFIGAVLLVILSIYTITFNEQLVTNEYWWLAMCICMATVLAGLIIMGVSDWKRHQYSSKQIEEFLNGW